MIQELPTVLFVWEKSMMWLLKKLDRLVKNENKVYVLEDDGKHLKEQHIKHNKLEFLAEIM